MNKIELDGARSGIVTQVLIGDIVPAIILPAIYIENPDAISCIDYLAYTQFVKNQYGVHESIRSAIRTKAEELFNLGKRGKFRIFMDGEAHITQVIEGVSFDWPVINQVLQNDSLEGGGNPGLGLNDIPFSIWSFSSASKIGRIIAQRVKGRMDAESVECGDSEVIVFQRPMVSVLFGRVVPHPNLVEPSERWLSKILDASGICWDILALKIGLINNGVVLDESMSGSDLRRGVNGSIDIVLKCPEFTYRGKIYDEITINCSYGNSISFLSGFKISPTGGRDSALVTISYLDRTILGTDGRPLEARIYPSMEQSESENAPSGVPLGQIALIATDRVRFQHNRSCDFAERGVGCRFCEFTANRPLGFAKAPISHEDLEYAVRRVLSESRPYSEYISKRAHPGKIDVSYVDHVLVGGGSIIQNERSIDRVVEMCGLIRKYEVRPMPIYAMILPPETSDDMRRLREAGVSEVAFNMEIFDPDIASELMPGKAKISRATYLERLADAVSVWPEPGMVRSALILGLEPVESTLRGVKAMSERHISPMLSLFRPTEGTDLEHIMPLDSESVYDIVLQAYDICKVSGVELGPACIYCQNNTLSMPSELVERSVNGH